MTPNRSFDVIVVGGGIAGSTLAGVLARSGVGVLVVEKEARFRDRIRGEGTYSWGVAEANRANVGTLFQRAGGVELVAYQKYEQQRLASTYRWATDSIDGLPEIGFSHPRLQETAFNWAASQGASVLRPAKAIAASQPGRASVTVLQDGQESEYSARLIVGGDGKLSAVRGWFGAETIADPEDHKFGGVLVSGVQTDDREADNVGDWRPDGSATIDVRVNWFAQSVDTTRLYLMGTAERLRALGVDRSFDALVAVAQNAMPAGALAAVKPEGPIGFFGNQDIWPSRISGDNIVLIGDAAGAPDPTQGHGTAILFRDVRELSELLLHDNDWPNAIAEFAGRRRRYFEVILAYDRWTCALKFGEGDAADRAREGNQRARQIDPTLQGFGVLEGRGPDGLVVNEASRQMFFGGAAA
jgi:2-polyprenyl-6-methoxyphenol hydroxylase-like FAD-dependent oxidoreductase